LLNADQARHIPAARDSGSPPVSEDQKAMKISVKSMIRPIDPAASIEWIDQRLRGASGDGQGGAIGHGASLPWKGTQQDRRGRAPGSGQHDGLAARSPASIE